MNKIDAKLVYRKSTSFVEKLIGDEMVLVPLSDNVADMNSVFTLNEVGTFIYSKINNTNTLSDILRELMSEYNVPENVAQQDFDSFIEKGIEKGIIIV